VNRPRVGRPPTCITRAFSGPYVGRIGAARPAVCDVVSCGIVSAVSGREIKVPMLVAAALCLLAALGGVALLFADSGQALGFAVLGFFGAGAYVLGRKGLGFD
jgi:hypothetical protein